MSSISFTPGTLIPSSWLNDVNSAVYKVTFSNAVFRAALDVFKDSLDIRSFGAKGDGVTDDTAAIQAVIDYAIANGLTVVDRKGGVFMLSSTITFNGTGHAEPANQQWNALKGFRGAGRVNTVFSVLPGFSSTAWIITARNTSGTTYEGFGYSGVGIAVQGFDFSWTGGSSGNALLAPSNQSVYRDMFGQGVSGWGFNFDQCHDSVIDGMTSKDVAAGNTAFTFRGPGGQMHASNINAATGRVVISCQNGGFSDCEWAGGLEITGSSFNVLKFTDVHFYPDPTNSMLVRSTCTGNAPSGVIFEACFFNTTPGYVVGGAFWQGAKFTGCLFNDSLSGFYAPITPLAGSGDVPLFSYEHCTFFGATLAFPGDIAGQVQSSHWKSKTNSGASYTSVNIPGTLWTNISRVGRSTPYNVEQLTVHSPLGPDTPTAAFGSPSGASAIIYAQAGTAANAASAAMRINASTATNRSISAGGTVNVGGADYAEYHQKCARLIASATPILKGQIIGFDVNDEITDLFSEAVGGFGVKSTDPSFVGGDKWAEGVDPTSPAYEVERQKVDRISYSGRVPTLVTGGSVGEYIVASADANGKIVGSLLSAQDLATTPSLYTTVVGRIRSISSDGYATIAVVVH